MPKSSRTVYRGSNQIEAESRLGGFLVLYFVYTQIFFTKIGGRMDYKNLSLEEGSSLSIKALGSQNPAEVKRLIDSCLIETNETAGLQYLNTTCMLNRVAGVFELEMRGLALNMSRKISDENADFLGKSLDQIEAAKAAWEGCCGQHGLTLAELIATVGEYPPIRNMLSTGLSARPELVDRWTELFRVAATEGFGEHRH
ncbi:hypothetical protein G7009_00905 [Pseudomonas capeferrum]|uniref:hypothetical protein n=1 Tax=Pseudomonas capeferrum TaxID=1495066 RepID=UPI0015E29601|nr:hypothetical protein [Pseudomonas capeferrum]MBA1200364.1 hypothetical protein [Pseudomonas capeferrum]